VDAEADPSRQVGFPQVTPHQSFPGSRTTGLAAARNGRQYLLIDQNPEAIAFMQTRLKP
jgi:hypothetical protein